LIDVFQMRCARLMQDELKMQKQRRKQGCLRLMKNVAIENRQQQLKMQMQEMQKQGGGRDCLRLTNSYARHVAIENWQQLKPPKPPQEQQQKQQLDTSEELRYSSMCVASLEHAQEESPDSQNKSKQCIST
jgi:hypothetical protein